LWEVNVCPLIYRIIRIMEEFGSAVIAYKPSA
jgi:hypothetical protein